MEATMDYIVIDKTSKIPLYIQISDSIRHHINLGILEHGTQLLTETSVCNIFEISAIVVKKAYDDLVKKGLVKRIRGKGTFVTTLKPQVIDLSEGLISITRYLMNTKRSVISFEKTNHHALNDIVDLAENENIYIVKTITLFNERPFMYQLIVLPEKYFPNLQKEDIRHMQMIDLVFKKYQLDSKKLIQSYRPINLNADISLLLNIQKNSPGHYIRSYIEDSNHHKLINFSIYVSAELFEFEVTVK